MGFLLKPYSLSFLSMQRLMLQPVPTKVVCLTEVVTVDELKDDDEYEDILEDMRTEGGKFGKILKCQYSLSPSFFRFACPFDSRFLFLYTRL